MVFSKERAMNNSPNWRVKNGHCITCGVKCFEMSIQVSESRFTSSKSFLTNTPAKKKKLSLKKLLLHNSNSNHKKECNTVTTELKTPITSYENNVVDGYCLNCNNPDYDTAVQEYGGNSDVAMNMTQTSNNNEYESMELNHNTSAGSINSNLNSSGSNSIDVRNIQQYVVTANAATVDRLNVKRLEDSEDYVVIGPGGQRTEYRSSSLTPSQFVPPERVKGGSVVR